jgi:hypothetical protein
MIMPHIRLKGPRPSDVRHLGQQTRMSNRVLVPDASIIIVTCVRGCNLLGHLVANASRTHTGEVHGYCNSQYSTPSNG